jgi:hypothetical protein
MVLAAWGNLGDCEIETNEDWLCAKEKDWSLIRPLHSFYVGMNENIGTGFGKNLVYEKAKVIRSLQCLDGEDGKFTEMSPWIVQKRIIPMLYLKPEKFTECSSADWLDHLLDKEYEEYADGMHMDMFKVTKWANMTDSGLWKKCSLEAVKHYILQQFEIPYPVEYR